MDSLTITLRDADVIRKLQRRAKEESVTVEDVIGDLVTSLPEPEPPPSEEPAPAKPERSIIRTKAYKHARDYWRKVGDEARAALTDEELDEQLDFFGENMIPYLKSDGMRPKPGSLCDLAEAAREAAVDLGDANLSERADDILNEEFGDYLRGKMDRQNNDNGAD